MHLKEGIKIVQSLSMVWCFYFIDTEIFSYWLQTSKIGGHSSARANFILNTATQPNLQRSAIFSLCWQLHYTLNVWSRGKQLVLFSRKVWCVLRRSRRKQQDSSENKTNQSPELQETTALLNPGQYIWIWLGAPDHESTNQSACFVE